MNSQKPAIEKCVKKPKYDAKRKSKIIIYAMLAGVIGVVVICLATVGVVTHLNKPQDYSNGTLIFHDADYAYDIMKDPNYIDLDRNIYFENTENGIKTAIVDGNLEDVPTDQREHVALLCNFITHAINGETEELNNLFSDEYVAAGGKVKMDFTMQQLYNIKITYIQSLDEVVDGRTYVSYDYWLEYMIRKNNGTFRNDMESDCVRKEYVRVTNRNGDVGIDVLSPYRTQSANNTISLNNEIIYITVVAVIMIVTVGWVVAVITKKRKQTPGK